MKAIVLSASVLGFVLSGCATTAPDVEARYSVEPPVQVTVKGGKKRATTANYQTPPEEPARTGSGGRQ